ncbi:hypothetical protein [Bacillus licheniformis]|uniref:hypothetical protein n=1 Tax=Bacillus licheniformis TaxID=1402 RepID=UPI0008FB13F3|nr:hypothetical protein [Bacillus licheniformis]OIS74629.1 hypothetical protein A4A40_18825 [Bacillus licheniformis]OIS80654.1 hypothetical protein A4A43_09610 [Bacillus licheniformis]OIS82237.1 hypothetical protein A4A38_05575 [Bacillus licheniformis]OIS89970.1 hypothetical protein A4A42_00110 [Bacillus licheniformis]TWK91155.1 hypothetical protein CHCC20327_2532 [Bacillus licheniformis]
MGEKVIRASDNEEVKYDIIDFKKLTTVMKRFLGSKKSDPEVTKWYKVVDGLHFMATTLGSAVYILFKNKYAGTFNKATGKDFFVKPLSNGKQEEVEAIPELEIVTEGKKKIERPTGRTLEYPDVVGLFNSFNLNDFHKVEIDVDDTDDFISVHEAMSKASKVGGPHNTAKMKIESNELLLKLHDSPIDFEFKYKIKSDNRFCFGDYHYDFDLMTAIFKSLKDLKPYKIEMYVRDIDHPVLFVGESTDYNFNFAIQRILVR